MLQQTAECLIHDENGIYVDCTLGGGGHSEYILDKYENTRVIGIDQDNDALKYAAGRLNRFGTRISLIKGNFKDIRSLVTQEVSGFLLDLGISSWQVDEADRVFSFRSQNLDMRMDTENTVSAENLINELRRLVLDLLPFVQSSLMKVVSNFLLYSHDFVPQLDKCLPDHYEAVYYHV